MKFRSTSINSITVIHATILACLMNVAIHASTATVGDEGWDVSYRNLVRLFGTYTSFELTDDMPGNDAALNETVFPVFHALTASSPEINGLRGSLEMYLQQGLLNDLFYPDESSFPGDYSDASTLQFQARAMYTGGFGGGNINIWLGGLWRGQEQDLSAMLEAETDRDSFGYNFGIDLNMAGFNITGSYYDGEARDFTQDMGMNGYGCTYVTCPVTDTEGYILKGAYTFFNGATRLGISYGESSQNANSMGAVATDSELWTVGLYHDVNSRFKIMAEFSDFGTTNQGIDDSRTFSLGGFISW